MRRIHERVGLMVAALAFALPGLQPCGAAEPAPRDGGSVIMAAGAQVMGFDPLTTRAANRETTMAGALMFSCNGRGTRLFDSPCHDIGVAHEQLPGVPLAGFFAAGEIGPVGGKNFIHGHTASFALFRAEESPQS